jgi:hypothetical protein
VHLAQGFDHHVARTNMNQGATLLSQSVFTVLIDFLSEALSRRASMVSIEG